MFTIRIKTKSTKKFTWSSSGARGFGERTTVGLREAVIDAVQDFRDYARGDGARDELHACLVTWEDGDDVHAFLLHRDGEIPAELPWILMRAKPQRVTREEPSMSRSAE